MQLLRVPDFTHSHLFNCLLIVLDIIQITQPSILTPQFSPESLWQFLTQELLAFLPPTPIQGCTSLPETELQIRETATSCIELENFQPCMPRTGMVYSKTGVRSTMLESRDLTWEWGCVPKILVRGRSRGAGGRGRG